MKWRERAYCGIGSSIVICNPIIVHASLTLAGSIWGWDEPTKHPTKNECMGRFAQTIYLVRCCQGALHCSGRTDG